MKRIVLGFYCELTTEAVRCEMMGEGISNCLVGGNDWEGRMHGSYCHIVGL
jgi:hypothetical protein